MKKIEDIVAYEFLNEIHKWSINTTKSNTIGFDKNSRLSSEVNSWDIHKQFVEKYGLMFSYPEDFVSIYILISLFKNSNIFCHPGVQNSDISLEKDNLSHTFIRWLFEEEIHYDNMNNFKTVSCEFSENVFEDFSDNRGFFKVFWDMAINNSPRSKLYELRNTRHIHQAVICGGNSDVYKYTNYIGVDSEDQKREVLRILSSKNKPTLDQILSNCKFFVMDFKGEDFGYARQMNIYSKKNIKEEIENIIGNFSKFQEELKYININTTDLNEYQSKLNSLEIKYGS
jgi:hypothetical protein